MPIRVILADDHPVVTHGIKNILDKDPAFEVLACFMEGRTLLQSPLLSRAELLVLDLNMPMTDGLKVLKHIQSHALPVKVVVLTAYFSPKLSEECRKAGAVGYVIKSQDLADLTGILSQVHQGRPYFPDFSGSAANTTDSFSYLDDFLKKYKLTKREVEVIRLLCQGMATAQIAEQLYLSTFTVQTHRKNIFKKLALDHSDSLSLYRFATQNGLV